MKETKFLAFIEFKDPRKNYVVMNKKDGSLLGIIYFYSKWKKFVLFTSGELVFDSTCLDDISSFMKELNKGE